MRTHLLVFLSMAIVALSGCFDGSDSKPEPLDVAPDVPLSTVEASQISMSLRCDTPPCFEAFPAGFEPNDLRTIQGKAILTGATTQTNGESYPTVATWDDGWHFQTLDVGEPFLPGASRINTRAVSPYLDEDGRSALVAWTYESAVIGRHTNSGPDEEALIKYVFDQQRWSGPEYLLQVNADEFRMFTDNQWGLRSGMSWTMYNPISGETNGFLLNCLPRSDRVDVQQNPRVAIACKRGGPGVMELFEAVQTPNGTDLQKKSQSLKCDGSYAAAVQGWWAAGSDCREPEYGEFTLWYSHGQTLLEVANLESPGQVMSVHGVFVDDWGLVHVLGRRAGETLLNSNTAYHVHKVFHPDGTLVFDGDGSLEPYVLGTGLQDQEWRRPMFAQQGDTILMTGEQASSDLPLSYVAVHVKISE